jgi:hypothetical protein
LSCQFARSEEDCATEALTFLLRVNLNQAVAKLNATGQRSEDLLPYAEACLRRAERLDAAAEHIRRRLG